MILPHSEFVYGYHGCHRKVAAKILNGEDTMLSSDNDYDWLGTGIYFWEDAPIRAYDWAVKRFGKDDAAVVGAKIRLGACLNLMDVESYQLLQATYESLKAAGVTLPSNGRYFHRLDCMVVNAATNYASSLGRPFDTVRCPFSEGKPVFPDSCLYDLSHIQVAVRNPAAIVELFAVD